MSEQSKGQPLAEFHKEMFVTSARAQVHLQFRAHGANLVIVMAAADAEALAEELVHAAARARDRDAQRTTKGRKC
jgi:hypothetical protein